MLAKNLHGESIEVHQDSIDELITQLNGPLYIAGDDDFEQAIQLWNACIDHIPALVVRCIGCADVIACIHFARAHDLLISIKGGGHHIAGWASAKGALMLDMSMMRSVRIDQENRIAHAQGGCLVRDIDSEAQLYGLATVLGVVSTCGSAGLTLGGGFGYLTRRWGWSADNIVGIDIVTAQGQQIRSSEHENPDLFWALRGGGGNFGVVTNIDYQLHALGPEIVGGYMAWPLSVAEQVLSLFKVQTEHAPETLTLALAIRPTASLQGLSNTTHEKSIIMILACYSGDVTEADALLAPLKQIDHCIADTISQRPYREMQTLLDTNAPAGKRHYWKSEYLPSLSTALFQPILHHTEEMLSPYCAITLWHIAGALNRQDSEYNAAGNREARYVITIAACWDNMEGDDANTGWGQESWQALKPFYAEGGCINFLSADDDTERTEAVFGEQWERLTRVKAKWDADNVWRVNGNIPPAQ